MIIYNAEIFVVTTEENVTNYEEGFYSLYCGGFSNSPIVKPTDGGATWNQSTNQMMVEILGQEKAQMHTHYV